MTRKDYVAIAAALKQARSFQATTQAAKDFNCGIQTAANRIAEHCALDNAAFDRARFMKACGVQS